MGPYRSLAATSQAYLSSLALKLQLLSQDMHDSIQDSMSQLISGLPRHAAARRAAAGPIRRLTPFPAAPGLPASWSA